jgi:TetR/AcrR family transcriptional repressor of nem operon
MSHAKPMPGRPRSFDEEQALAAAMQVFWSKGFNDTSYTDLEHATGLRRQSLIYAFGDKQSMFEKVVAHYVSQRVSHIIGLLESADSPMAGIRSVFAAWSEDAAHPTRRGCLLVNAAAEIGAKDPAIAVAVRAATHNLTAAFEKAFKRAQKAGEISAQWKAGDLARLAVAAGDGALLHARVNDSAKDTARAYRAFVALLT